MAIALRGSATAVGTTGSVTTLDSNVPTGTLDGDLLLWIMSSVNVTVPSTPSGWALWDSLVPASAGSLVIWYRFASSEPSFYTSSGMTSARYATAMYAFSGVDQTTPKDVANTKTSGTNTGIVQPTSITPVSNGAMIFDVEHLTTTAGITGSFATSNMSLGHTVNSTSGSLSNAISGAGWLLQTTAAAFTGAFTTGVSGANSSRSLAISSALRPAIYPQRKIGFPPMRQAVNRSLTY